MITSCTDASLAGDTSWARLATRAPGRTHTSPASGTIWRVISCSSEDLPSPLRPSRQRRSPRRICRSAWSSRGLRPKLKETLSRRAVGMRPRILSGFASITQPHRNVDAALRGLAGDGAQVGPGRGHGKVLQRCPGKKHVLGAGFAKRAQIVRLIAIFRPQQHIVVQPHGGRYLRVQGIASAVAAESEQSELVGAGPPQRRIDDDVVAAEGREVQLRGGNVQIDVLAARRADGPRNLVEIQGVLPLRADRDL